jgi:hypothetical protein
MFALFPNLAFRLINPYDNKNTGLLVSSIIHQNDMHKVKM